MNWRAIPYTTFKVVPVQKFRLVFDNIIELDPITEVLVDVLERVATQPEPYEHADDSYEPTLVLTRRKQPSIISEGELEDITEHEAPTTIWTRPTPPTFDDSSDVRPIGSTEEDDSGNVVLSLCRPKKGPIAIQPVMTPPRPTSRHATEQAIAS